MISKIRACPHYLYKKYIYERVKHIRGTTRLKNILSEIAVTKTREDPESIFEREDWDNLIILDACRYDIYNEVTGRDVEKRISLGSTSQEYFGRTFNEGDFSDTVYISANGFAHDSNLKKYAGRSSIFHEKFLTTSTDWDDELGVTPPGPVARDARTAEELFPSKKKIIHFLQPHDPFIQFGLKEKIEEYNADRNEYDLAAEGVISDETLREGYKHNLILVLGVVEELLADMKGKTVITADHGDLLGEAGV